MKENRYWLTTPYSEVNSCIPDFFGTIENVEEYAQKIATALNEIVSINLDESIIDFAYPKE